MKTDKTAYSLFVMLVLSSVGFFNYHAMISMQMQKLFFYLCLVIAGGYVMYSGVSLKSKRFPRLTYGIMMTFIAFSTVMASAFHPQGFMVSVMTTLPFLFAYCSFYLLLGLGVNERMMIRVYIMLCAISTLVYFANAATAPNNIFGEPIINEDISRGVVRLPVVFIEMFPLLVFYAINRLLLTGRKIWIVVIVWGLLMVVLSVTRQIIASTVVLGAWFYFRRVSTVKKLLMVVAVAAVALFVLPEIPMYKAMMELSEDQRDENELNENIRITAWRYYTYENQTNALTPIFGNGIPSLGNSPWGIMFDSETEDNGCFTGDVGWAAFFWYFGIIATIALIVMFFMAFKRRKSPSGQYLNYWLVYIFLTSVASGPIVYFNWIFSIMVVFAVIFGTATPEASAATGETAVAPALADKPSIRIRYPQLTPRRKTSDN